MRKLLLLLGIVLFVFPSYGQNDQFGHNGFTIYKPRNKESIEGNPYLHENFHIGMADGGEGYHIPDVLIRFNKMENNLEVDHKNRIIVLNRKLYHNFTYKAKNQNGEDQEYTFRNRLGSTDFDYYQVLFECPEFGFYKKYLTSIYTSKPKTHYDRKKEEKKYKHKEKYFVLFKGELKEVKKKKDILKALEKPDAFSKLIKDEKLKMKSEEEIVAGLELYSRLLSQN